MSQELEALRKIAALSDDPDGGYPAFLAALTAGAGGVSFANSGGRAQGEPVVIDEAAAERKRAKRRERGARQYEKWLRSKGVRL